MKAFEYKYNKSTKAYMTGTHTIKEVIDNYTVKKLEKSQAFVRNRAELLMKA